MKTQPNKETIAGLPVELAKDFLVRLVSFGQGGIEDDHIRTLCEDVMGMVSPNDEDKRKKRIDRIIEQVKLVDHFLERLSGFNYIEKISGGRGDGESIWRTTAKGIAFAVDAEAHTMQDILSALIEKGLTFEDCARAFGVDTTTDPPLNNSMRKGAE